MNTTINAGLSPTTHVATITASVDSIDNTIEDTEQSVAQSSNVDTVTISQAAYAADGKGGGGNGGGDRPD